jgi:hypothetical protein
MTSVHQFCRQGLEKPSETMRKYHDKKAKLAPAYQPGDFIMLNGKNLKTRRPAKKLDAKLHGPFKVMKVMLPTAHKVELPRRWPIHDAFYIFLIEFFRIASNGF